MHAQNYCMYSENENRTQILYTCFSLRVILHMNISVSSSLFLIPSPALVNESYDTHPGFTLPEASYSLSLSKTPPQHLQFQTLVDTLHESLRQNSSQSLSTLCLKPGSQYVSL